MNKYFYVADSKIHSKGAYAKKLIRKGTRIVQYIGEIVSKEEGERRDNEQLMNNKKNNHKGATYMFELDDEHDIDGDVPKNHAKFINHSCSPNCDYEIINNEIWYYAIKDISKDEELTINYDFELTDNYYDHVCNCGSDNCLGYIISPTDREKLKLILDNHKILKQ